MWWVNFPTVSRNHSRIYPHDDGQLDRVRRRLQGRVCQRQAAGICALEPEDTITIGGVDMNLLPISARQEARSLRSSGPRRPPRPAAWPIS